MLLPRSEETIPPPCGASLCYGVLYCLVKPISFTIMRQGLKRYCAYRDRLARCGQFVVQAEVDDLLASRHERDHGHLPKGVCAETLDSVVGELCAADGCISLSATEVARIMGASRVTARRYLEYLADAGLARRDLRYGMSGPPRGGVSMAAVASTGGRLGFSSNFRWRFIEPFPVAVLEARAATPRGRGDDRLGCGTSVKRRSDQRSTLTEVPSRRLEAQGGRGVATG